MLTVLEELTLLDLGLATSSPEQSNTALLAVSRRLRDSRDVQEIGRAGLPALGLLQRLYHQGRSIDALPLALALHERTRDPQFGEVCLRASLTCGLLMGDTGDFASALDYQSAALAHATNAGDMVAASRAWNNIGLAFTGSGHEAQALAAYSRAVECVEDVSGPVVGRFSAYMNLAIRHTTLDNAECLRFAKLAFAELDAGLPNIDDYSRALLHRTVVRLYVQAGRLADADQHLRALSEFAKRSATVRATIVAETAAAALELARGQADVALTRLELALTDSRTAWPMLRDTLACVVRAEAKVGSPGRALIRLRELSEILHQRNVSNAKDHRAIADWRPVDDSHLPGFDGFIGTYLRPQLNVPSAPDDWGVLTKLAIGTSLQMDGNGAHGLRVGALSEMLASAIGFSPIEALEIGCAAQLHDIGIACGHESLLPVHASSTAVGDVATRDHCETGWALLADDTHPRLLMAREIARYHHAAWNGAGYPAGVANVGIPIHARICAVADAFDSLLCEGESGAFSLDDALGELLAMSGTRLDPKLTRRFVDALRDEVRNEGVDLDAKHGLANLHQLVESLSNSRNYI